MKSCLCPCAVSTTGVGGRQELHPSENPDVVRYLLNKSHHFTLGAVTSSTRAITKRLQRSCIVILLQGRRNTRTITIGLAFSCAMHRYKDPWPYR